MSSIDQAFIRAYQGGAGVVEAPLPPQRQASPQAAPQQAAQHPAVAPPHFAVAPAAGRPAAATLRRRATPEAALVVERLSWSDDVLELADAEHEQLTRMIEDLSQVEGLIGLASAGRGAGATTLLLALARTAARDGARVAVVDCGDGAVLRSLGLVRTPTLATAGSLRSAIVHARQDGLSVVQSWTLGQTPATPGPLLESLGALSEEHDMALCDLGLVSARSPLGAACRAIVAVAQSDATGSRLGAEVAASWPRAAALGVVVRPEA
ncbi:hypothetical protein Pla175_08210 [Pirellulimonas nuda]|uniref:CobQ/CobB/MinD/ParA nucleotide binding domain protein n=1 Tax=Pirellulimonas nuda TaxID=2528009 RepID=A0A518D7N5_9BACT|nr:hypothetical protein [Pirellulimonas nuda]QDU87459.1 hypothetical protein Pla175_08210 [Pirellulimonas nuda]